MKQAATFFVTACFTIYEHIQYIRNLSYTIPIIHCQLYIVNYSISQVLPLLSKSSTQ